jgi:hypothetical protein
MDLSTQNKLPRRKPPGENHYLKRPAHFVATYFPPKETPAMIGTNVRLLPEVWMLM